mmetsp:Transcript_12122/g.15380  ORF Transcript_12122/g.15380 Transcript_12122/m.15380 type:complete len:125 (+) Transcript_12122:3-377(+)
MSFSSMSSIEEGSVNREHRRRARARRKKLPTIVPPSPGRKKGEVSQEIRDKMENLQSLLDTWEANQGSKRFSGKVSNLKDFLKIDEPSNDDDLSSKEFSKSSTSIKKGTIDKRNAVQKQRVGRK